VRIHIALFSRSVRRDVRVRTGHHTTRQYNYGPAGFDRRHLFGATYTYRIPFFRKSRGFAGGACGGWEVSGITRMQSGPPLIATGTPSIPGTRRSSYLGGPVSLPGDQRGPDKWFNTAAFATRRPRG